MKLELRCDSFGERLPVLQIHCVKVAPMDFVHVKRIQILRSVSHSFVMLKLLFYNQCKAPGNYVIGLHHIKAHTFFDNSYFGSTTLKIRNKKTYIVCLFPKSTTSGRNIIVAVRGYKSSTLKSKRLTAKRVHSMTFINEEIRTSNEEVRGNVSKYRKAEIPVESTKKPNAKAVKEFRVQQGRNSYSW